MINAKNQKWWGFIFPATLVLMILGAYLYMDDRRSRAIEAARDAAACRALVARLEQFRALATNVGASDRSPADLGTRLESAALVAEFPPENIVRVSPEAPRRIGDAPYRQTITIVLLRNVSLKQIITFLHAIASTDPALQIKSIRLDAPREARTSETWTAELTMSCLTYSPKSSSKSTANQTGKEN